MSRPDGMSQTREVRPNAHYASSGSAEVHFGLGESEAPVDVTVTWPDGTESFFKAVAVNQHLTLSQTKLAAKSPALHW